MCDSGMFWQIIPSKTLIHNETSGPGGKIRNEGVMFKIASNRKIPKVAST